VRWRSALGLALLCFATTGCQTYWYRGREYPTDVAMFRAQRGDEQSMLRRIRPAQTPVATYCRVFVPNMDAIRERALIASEPNSYIADVVVKSVYNAAMAMARAVQARRMCKAIEIVVGDAKPHTPPNDEVFISLVLTDIETAGWQVALRNRSKYVQVDGSIPGYAPKVYDWLSRVENYLAMGTELPCPTH
jgi:hypothetical protein